MAEADGSIRIVTKMDSASLARQMSSLGKAIERLQTLLDKAKEAARGLREQYEAMIKAKAETIRADSTKGIEDERKKISALNKEYKELVAERERLGRVRDIVASSGQTPTKQLEDEIAANNAAISRVLQERRDSQANIRQYQSNIENAHTLATESADAKKLSVEVDKAEEKVESLSNQLEESKKNMEGLRREAVNVGNDSDGLKKASKNAGDAGERIKKLTGYVGTLARRFVLLYALRNVFSHIRQSIMAMSGLSVVTGVFSDFNNRMREAYQTNEQIQGALARLRGALYVAFTPIYQAIVPALVTLINWLSRAITYIAAFFSALSGNKLADSAEGAKNLAKGISGVGGAAKQANKQLAAFDRLNTLSENTSGGGGGGGAAPDVQIGNGLVGEAGAFGDKVREILDKINELMPAIEMALGGFSLGLGAILLFTGANVPLGLGLMVTGALLIAKSAKEDWSKVPTQVQDALIQITTIISSALLVIGVVLLFSGHIGLGLGLVIAGLAGFAAVGMNWNNLSSTVKNKASEIMAILGGFMLVVGIILTMAGVFPLGIGLMAAGGVALGSAIALNWDAIKEKVIGVWEGIKRWWDTNVAKYFTKEYWQDKIDKMFDVVAHLTLPVISWDSQPVWDWLAPVLEFFNLPPVIPVPSVHWQKFAAGGFPSSGSMFFAGEAGPELVGSFGGRNNAVINEAQLVQAFKQASSEQVALLQQQNSLLAAILNKSGELTFKPSSAAGRAFQQSINMYNRAMG